MPKVALSGSRSLSWLRAPYESVVTCHSVLPYSFNVSWCRVYRHAGFGQAAGKKQHFYLPPWPWISHLIVTSSQTLSHRVTSLHIEPMSHEHLPKAGRLQKVQPVISFTTRSHTTSTKAAKIAGGKRSTTSRRSLFSQESLASASRENTSLWLEGSEPVGVQLLSSLRLWLPRPIPFRGTACDGLIWSAALTEGIEEWYPSLLPDVASAQCSASYMITEE